MKRIILKYLYYNVTPLGIIIVLALLMPACSSGPNLAGNPENNVDARKTELNAIYATDQNVREQYQKQDSLRAQVLQVTKENHLEDAKELADQSNKLAKTINELEIQLANLMDRHQKEWDNQDWFNKITVELGPQYTYFDNDLKIEDGFGSRLRISNNREELKRIHTYPLIPARNEPLRRVDSSLLIIELRNSQTRTTTGAKISNATVNTGLVGFGVDGEIREDMYLGLNLLVGGQQYNNTVPEDTAPMVSYSTGIKQYLSPKTSLGLSVAEDVVWTNATRDNNKIGTFYNFSITLLLRIRL
ncbi:MAG: hypothetical protein V1701_09075 [Planctomycetota bacterium]